MVSTCYLELAHLSRSDNVKFLTPCCLSFALTFSFKRLLLFKFDGIWQAYPLYGFTKVVPEMLFHAIFV